MGIRQEELLDQIFSDALVVDFDLSEWDKRLIVCVVADHVDLIGGYLPCFAVEFVAPSSIELGFVHHELGLHHDPRHIQWRIDELHLEESSDEFSIELVGSGSSPVLRLKCKDVLIRRVLNEHLHRILPGWSDPYSPLARPGIEKLIEQARRKR